ncbi:type I-MYXAN CRISPR-associated protein Cas6/Cmx6 [Leptolyngbya sp. PL-A3]|uniref:type I-MYXAN CRISPR-associated protein Cas6/Cmx6 n=1 Tax=Leptolyngbya sp. PL-A3 TaxID=2933911 RepID=UPI001747C2BA|nr:type I-MYXAN CRISPR-associated protein Cas6/Cmx6 [Phormidium tenue FACHB-886]
MEQIFLDNVPVQNSQQEYSFHPFYDEVVSPLPHVDLNFRVQGKVLPSDHSYALYAALSHFQDRIHSLEDIGIQPITGIQTKEGVLTLNDTSCLRIRVPAELVPLLYPLAGKQLTIGKHEIWLGIPEIHLLKPATKLYSRIVTIRGFQEPEPFLEAVERQLQQRGIRGRVSLFTNTEGIPRRRTLQVKKYTIVGFGVEIEDLCEEDSLLLQTYGIGGKRKMGCGIFLKH